MNFRDRLALIADTSEFERSVAKHCTEIKNKMEKATYCGYRTFQIEIVNIRTGLHLPATAPNCYSVTEYVFEPTVFDSLVKSIKANLYKLGFTDIDYADIVTNNKHTIVLKVEW